MPTVREEETIRTCVSNTRQTKVLPLQQMLPLIIIMHCFAATRSLWADKNKTRLLLGWHWTRTTGSGDRAYHTIPYPTKWRNARNVVLPFPYKSKARPLCQSVLSLIMMVAQRQLHFALCDNEMYVLSRAMQTNASLSISLRRPQPLLANKPRIGLERGWSRLGRKATILFEINSPNTKCSVIVSWINK